MKSLILKNRCQMIMRRNVQKDRPEDKKKWSTFWLRARKKSEDLKIKCSVSHTHSLTVWIDDRWNLYLRPQGKQLNKIWVFYWNNFNLPDLSLFFIQSLIFVVNPSCKAYQKSASCSEGHLITKGFLVQQSPTYNQ